MWFYRTVLLIAFTLLTNNAFATESYVIQGVEVEATAKNATIARNKAISYGEQDAFRQLLEKILPSENNLPTFTKKDIKNLILSRQIKNEKFSSSSYRGIIDVKFSKQRVSEFLKENNMGYLKSSNTSILIIPIFREKDKIKLWEEDNIWRNAWSDASSNFFTIVLPRGDIEDITTANKYDILREREESLRDIAARYGVEDVVIAEASYPTNDSMRITTKYYDGVELIETKNLVQGKKISSLKELLQKGVTHVTNDIDNMWKGTARNQSDTKMQLIVPISSLEEWSEIRQKLAQMSTVIESVKLDAIGYGQVDVGVSMTDYPENLVPHFRRRGLELFQDGEYWILTKESFHMDN